MSIRRLLVLFLFYVFIGCQLTAGEAQTVLERIASEAQSPERPLRERARRSLVPLLKHKDLALRAQAFALYGQWIVPSDPPTAQVEFWNAGREQLPNGSPVHQYCSLNLAHGLFAQGDLVGAQTLAEEVHKVAAQTSPRGIDAVVMLGLIAATKQDFAQGRAALTLAEWIIRRGPDYAVAGFTKPWLEELSRAVNLLDPEAEQQCWRQAEKARGNGQWSAALAA